MQKDLLEGVSARARTLGDGGYARVYRARGKEYPTQLHLLIGQIIESLGLRYKTGVPIFPGSRVVADFAVGDRLIVLDKTLSEEDVRRVRASGRTVVRISESALRSDALDAGIRVSGKGTDDDRLQTIFLDDPSFNFDYAHILPMTEKCSVMHGHTSSALVELVGRPNEGMVIDFNDAKPIIREAISALDHKLFINEKYVVEESKSRVRLEFETVHGRFEMNVPKKTTVLMTGEATVENLALELLRRISPRMPENIEAVGVYVYEGLNKGSHLLARIHSREAEQKRKS